MYFQIGKCAHCGVTTDGGPFISGKGAERTLWFCCQEHLDAAIRRFLPPASKFEWWTESYEFRQWEDYCQGQAATAYEDKMSESRRLHTLYEARCGTWSDWCRRQDQNIEDAKAAYYRQFCIELEERRKTDRFVELGDAVRREMEEKWRAYDRETEELRRLDRLSKL